MPLFQPKAQLPILLHSSNTYIFLLHSRFMDPKETVSRMGDPTQERHSDEEYIVAVRGYEPAATSEVAEKVGVARQSADYRLRQLEAEEKVRSKKAGSSLVWVELVECERCHEGAPRGDIRFIMLGGAMKPVEPHEKAPISDVTVHELCPDCAEEWREWLQKGSGSFNSFLEAFEE